MVQAAEKTWAGRACRAYRGRRVGAGLPFALAAAAWVGLCAAPGAPLRAGTHAWTGDIEGYQILDPVAARDGFLTYDINLAGFGAFGGRGYRQRDFERLDGAVRRAFAKWNQVLKPIGLQFREAQGDEVVELPVRAMPYDELIFFGRRSDSVAVSMGWPFRHVYTIMPIWFDDTEDLYDLSDRPVVTEGLLTDPYCTLVESAQYDLGSVALHEIGHVLGLGHVAEAVRAGDNYNFLGLSSVLVDPSCLSPSGWVGGMDVWRRRPLLEVEVPSIMVPIRAGVIFREITPEDRATVAFLLRHLNPDGADGMLREAQEMYRRTTPLRFANVVYELEKNGQAERNDTIEGAMPIVPNQVVIGSLFGRKAPEDPLDQDVYRLDLTGAPAGAVLVLDIDEAAGLYQTGAVGVRLDLLDEQGNVVASGGAAGEIDEGSYSALDPMLTWALQRPGVYFVAIVQDEQAEWLPGSYVLKVGLGRPAEPGPIVEPTIDSSGSAGCPTGVPPAALACPAVGFGLLSAVPCVLLGLRRRRI